MRVITVANELLSYTIRSILCKEEMFPKRSRWLMAGKLADLLNDFHSYVQTANEIRVVTLQEAEDRHRYNTLALAKLMALDAKMNVAAVCFNINKDDLEYFEKLVNTEQTLLKGCIAADQKTYTSLQK